MSERVVSEPTIVCPFLAYEDERDFRASVPHHRHRCFADSPPGPRALAHQAAYCLTSAFAGCPTFVDWARREAAPARDVVPPSRTLRDAPAARGAALPAAAVVESIERGAPPTLTPASPAVPPQAAEPPLAEDWAASPAWAPPARPVTPAELDVAEDGEGEAPGQASLGMLDEPEPPAFLAGRTLDDGRPVAYQQVARPLTHRAPVGHAGLGAEHQTDMERASDPAAPPWERPRRKDAYPTLRTRAGFRPGGKGVPRLAAWAAILGIALVIVFAAPFVFRGLVGGGTDGGPSPSPSTLASPTAEPTPTPEPVATPLVYTVKSGDTLSKIATKYNVTIDQILEANPAITNPNRIAPGDKITIPTPPPDEVVDAEITPAP